MLLTADGADDMLNAKLKPKVEHPRDTQLRELLPEIHQTGYFTACVFLGSGSFAKVELKSLAYARAAAPLLEALFVRESHGRRAMIYAITADGTSFFVPADFNPDLPLDAVQPEEA